MTDFARLVLDADTRGLKSGERDLNNFSKTAGGTASAVSAAFGRMGAALGAAFGASTILRINSEFGASMSRVAAISGATAGELSQLRETAIQMGADTAFSAGQAADALGFLAMAGFSASEAMEAIPDVLSLAAASGMDLAEAADIASNVLSGFGKAAADAGQVSDVLALAASRTNTNVSQLGQAMSTAAPIAAALGISMEETAAAIGVMSDAGIQGERAGTALRGVFASLAGPTTQAQEALAKYGLTAAQIDPQTVGLAEAMEVLRDANVSTADAFVIFGREAASGALVMAETSDRIRELTGDFRNAEGAAGEMAKVMRDNLAGDIDQLTGSVETLIIRMGDGGLAGGFRSLAQVATSSINFITANMQTLSSVVMTVGGAWAAYRLTLLAISGATVAYTAAVGAMNSAMIAAVFGTRSLTAVMAANPFTAVAAAVGILAGAFITLANAQATARAETNNLITSLKAAAQARSADFASQRALLAGRLAVAEGTDPNGGFLASMRPSWMQDAAASARTSEIIQLRRELNLADKAYAEAGKAAEAMAVPTASAGAAVAGLGNELKEATGSTKSATNEFQALYDRLFPFAAATREFYREMAMIQKSRLSDAEKEEAIARLERQAFESRTRGLGPAFVSNNLLNADPLIDVGETARKVIGDLEKDAKQKTTTIADSFGQMAQRVTSSLQGLANSIQSGNFLGILGGVLDIFMQAGSMGAFGKTIQGNLNRPVSGARAAGGQVNAGRSYLVGERGPELFTPPGHGRIVSNDNLRGGSTHVTVGIDPANGNITAFVNGQIAATAPAIAGAGAAMAQGQMAQQQRRRVR